MGAVSFPNPFRRLSVPPLAGLEGQGCGALGCRGSAAGLLSALPQHSSSSIVPIPMSSSSPTSITGAALEEVTVGLIAMGAVDSSLLQPSVHSVEDLEVMASSHRPLPSHSLCGRVSLPDGDHSVCAPGGASGGLAGLHRSDGSVPPVPVPRLLGTFFASCSVTLSITSKCCALASPRLRRSSPGSWLLFQLYSILWGSV